MKCKQVLYISIALLFSLHLEAQDVIYKKNGEIISTIILDTSLKSVRYRLQDQYSNYTHYITTDIIDSIIYHDGRKAIFNTNTPNQSNQSAARKIRHNHHLIGFDVAGLSIYRNLAFSYEFQPGKAMIGFKASYMYRKRNQMEWNRYIHFTPANDADWTFSIGSNLYIFPPKNFRIGTGLHYIFGKYSTTSEGTYPYTNYYDDNFLDKNPLNGLMGSIFGFYNITKYIAANIGVYVPVHMNPESTLTLHLEVMLNF